MVVGGGEGFHECWWSFVMVAVHVAQRRGRWWSVVVGGGRGGRDRCAGHGMAVG